MKKIEIDLVYYNAVFRIVTDNEMDVSNLLQFIRYTREHGTTMKRMSEWLKGHGLEYTVNFVWKKEYPLTANLWNLLSFTRFRIEEWIKQ